MAIMIIIVLVLIILAICQTKRNNAKSDIKEEQVDGNPYTTMLQIRPEILSRYSPDRIGCREKSLFIPSEGRRTEILIGTYQQADWLTGGGWEVFNVEANLIGVIDSQSDNIMFYNPANKASGCFAERIQSRSQPMIIDRDTYDWLADFEGDSVEAAAAFVCWAYISQGNKYSDFFH